MKISAAPGIYLCTPIVEEVTINLGKSSDKKLIKGKIIDLGLDRMHDSGGKMTATYKKGDVIYFLNYEASYDNFEEDGQKYFVVLFNDVRAKIE